MKSEDSKMTLACKWYGLAYVEIFINNWIHICIFLWGWSKWLGSSGRKLEIKAKQVIIIISKCTPWCVRKRRCSSTLSSCLDIVHWRIPGRTQVLYSLSNQSDKIDPPKSWGCNLVDLSFLVGVSWNFKAPMLSCVFATNRHCIVSHIRVKLCLK